MDRENRVAEGLECSKLRLRLLSNLESRGAAVGWRQPPIGGLCWIRCMVVRKRVNGMATLVLLRIITEIMGGWSGIVLHVSIRASRHDGFHEAFARHVWSYPTMCSIVVKPAQTSQGNRAF
jgi:hypothetical protein